MPKTQIKCPQCRQPIIADIQQLFDVAQDPSSKQIFLSGSFNFTQCPNCGYRGMLASPLVYHDPEKELLLTYFPPELALPLPEQEKIIGPLINRVVNSLPQEKRKGYLFNPKTMLTLQVMLETVLEADGITKEMIKAQEGRLNLIQRLLAASEDVRIEIIQQEDQMIDRDFFGILSRLLEVAVSDQDQTSISHLNDLQKLLLLHSTQGEKLKKEASEVQAAIQSLRDMGEDINREKLLDLVIKMSSETQLRTLAQLARPLMDYSFFQILSERIDRARSKGRGRLVDIRDKLLAYTQDVDQEMARRSSIARQNVEALLQVDDIKSALQQNVDAIDEFFVQAVTQALSDARKAGNLEHSSRLQQILDIIDELSTPPPEFTFIEELLEIADDDNALKQAVESRGKEITSDFLQMLNSLITQTQASIEQSPGKDKDHQKIILDRLQTIYDTALGFSMRRNFQVG